MRHVRALAITAIAAPLIAIVAYAQSSVTPMPEEAQVQVAPLEIDLSKALPGDAAAGEQKAQVCAACHGADGNSAIEMYPRLAGQSERYIAQQLALIASGQRTEGMVAVMLPFVEGMTPQDMRDLGAYFATQKSGAGVADDAEVADGTYAGMKFYEIGQALYRGGDAKRGIPACMACHGPNGAGNPGPAYPHIGGQHAAYTAQRLQYYQAGQTQETDPAHFRIMEQVTHSLTEQEIQALSSYVQGLHARADDVDAAPAQP
ncbi:c-type cytochrome [Stenotrophomonas sp. NLF4-10]|uniref:c-type cytochrome n=1 Tax=Stenotrophomonas sp. NLF4-10 TaxID=2918754 RepID=UPI001EFBAC13|nr:c-type cytochrome [Stenotrophomonas sp. NLF4-10]MCG8275749.1 cytochrome c4 [Stenotrophomonas sp. NLF4-10]